MADRVIVYPYEGVQDVDILNTNKNSMLGLAYLTQAVLGSGTLVDGLACTPSTPASMTVNLATGSIYSIAPIDATAYGSLAADTTDQIVKQGIVVGSTPFTLTAPTTSGQSVVYIIQAQFQEVDGNPINEPFINATTGAAYNSTQNTVRKDRCILSLKQGVIAPTGSQNIPAPDAGYVGLWAITIANGATTITSGNIALYPGAPFIVNKLSSLRTRLTSNATYYVSPTGNDSNAGTILSPFQTIQYALNYVANNLDLAGYAVTIQLGDNGTVYAGASLMNSVFGGTVTISGNVTSPNNTQVAYLYCSNSGINLSAQYIILGNTSTTCLQANNGAVINIGAGTFFGGAVGQVHVAATNGGEININSGYTITGSAANHMLTANGGKIITGGGFTVGLIGSPAFSSSFAQATNTGVISLPNLSYSGSATGQKYNVSSNAVINTNTGGSASYFPGSVAGSTATGGQYV